MIEGRLFIAVSGEEDDVRPHVQWKVIGHIQGVKLAPGGEVDFQASLVTLVPLRLYRMISDD